MKSFNWVDVIVFTLCFIILVVNPFVSVGLILNDIITLGHVSIETLYMPPFMPLLSIVVFIGSFLLGTIFLILYKIMVNKNDV